MFGMPNMILQPGLRSSPVPPWSGGSPSTVLQRRVDVFGMPNTIWNWGSFSTWARMFGMPNIRTRSRRAGPESYTTLIAPISSRT
jgi:hypothetical protein